MSYIGLLDCNNFFVSCERLFRPDLKTHPTLVLSSNDGCVVARSQEVKDLGIPMGVPYFKVRDIIKKNKVAVFSSNFQLYRDISSRVMSTLKREVGKIEQYSIDESFFLIEEKEKDVENLLLGLRGVILREIGVPVSLGVAKTKTIAKYASNKEKKGRGACFLVGESWKKLTPSIRMEEIWGIGGKTSTYMRQNGINTVADFLKTDRAIVDKLFGLHGLRVYSELEETQTYGMFEESELQHSIMNSRSLKDATNDIKILADALSYHVANSAAELRELNAVTQMIRVILRGSRHSDWSLRGGSKEVMLGEPTSDTRVILRVATKLLQELHEPGVPFKKVGVVLSMITDATLSQSSLFEDRDGKDKGSAVMSVVDSLNAKLGKNKVTIGRLENSTSWKSSNEFVSPQYTTNWSDIRTIKS